jgi:hypothetical protein
MMNGGYGWSGGGLVVMALLILVLSGCAVGLAIYLLRRRSGPK